MIRWFIRLKATIVRARGEPEPFLLSFWAPPLQDLMWRLEHTWIGWILLCPVIIASVAAFWQSVGLTTTLIIHAGLVGLFTIESKLWHSALFCYLAALYHFCYGAFVVYFWVSVLLRLEVTLATLFLLGLFPWVFSLIGILYLSAITFIDLWLSEEASIYVLLFGFGVSPSLVLTLTALSVGHTIHPQEWVPRTVQMMLVNLLCDATTLLATYLVLSRAMSRSGRLRIPAAIVIDTVIAAVLACLSLYGGLVATERALSVREVLNVLVARTPDGNETSFGPLFWVMHTTFIPTIGYLALLGMAWLGKTVLLISKALFGIGYAHENPLKLSAALCALIAAISKGIATVLREVAPYLTDG